MPFRKQQHPRKPIRAQTINYGVEARNGLDDITVAPPLQCFRTHTGGILLSLAASSLGVAIAQSGGSGIPARSSATPGNAVVTIQQFNGTALSASSQTVTAYNLSASAVGATKYLVLLKIWSRWWVIWEDCG